MPDKREQVTASQSERDIASRRALMMNPEAETMGAANVVRLRDAATRSAVSDMVPLCIRKSDRPTESAR
jgi:hypothetical protein